MYEHYTHPVISRAKFAMRMAAGLKIVVILAAVSLGVGMLGYHYLEKFSWIDAFLNASMILGGMGEVDPIKTDSGKIFAGFYALYSGLVVIAMTGILLAPVIHRIMHTLHQEKK